MKQIANLLFEIRLLKDIQRSGYAFLGTGNESIAEHSFSTAFICFVMAKMVPGVDSGKMMAMALVHDIPEARMGDLNYVQKKYVQVDEEKAIAHLTRKIPFGNDIKSLLFEFNEKKTMESLLVNDADQLSFILELKKHKDIGDQTPKDWLPTVISRLKTEIGKKIADEILETRWDDWWMTDYDE